jgi:PncC family amidohydrolase
VIEGSSLSPVMKPLQEMLRAKQTTIATAESSTGGLIAAALTDLPGSSEYFLGGVVAYSNEAKIVLLGVDPGLIKEHGAVSPQVAEQMARGARRLFGAGIAVSVTGIAGPGSDGTKSQGLTYVAANREDTTLVREHHWNGGRAANRVASVEAALALAAEILR